MTNEIPDPAFKAYEAVDEYELEIELDANDDDLEVNELLTNVGMVYPIK